MANFINYADIAPQNLQSGLSDIFANMLQGYKISKEPAKMATDQQKNVADAMLAGLKAQAFPEQNRADLAYKQSETYKNLHPDEYQTPTGAAGEVEFVERARNKYGENSPQYAMIKGIMDAKQKEREANANYKSQVLGLRQESNEIAKQRLENQQNANEPIVDIPGAPTRGDFSKLPQLEKISWQKKKLLKENNALNPDGTANLDALSPAALSNYQALRQQYRKGAATAQTKNRLDTADILHSMFSQIDPEVVKRAFNRYSGIYGPATLAADATKAQKHENAPEEYYEYMAYKNFAESASSLLGKFWGTSIDPKKAKENYKLIDPVGIFSSGKEAYNNFLLQQQLFDTEHSSLQDQVRDPMDPTEFDRKPTIDKQFSNLFPALKEEYDHLPLNKKKAADYLISQGARPAAAVKKVLSEGALNG